MANTDAPCGFKPVRYRSGAPYNGAFRRYYIGTGDSNNIFIGDPVALSGTGGSAGGLGGARPAVVRATAGAGSSAGDGPVGVVVGFENLTSDNLSRTYRPASTAGYLLVCDDPDVVYHIQEDSDGGALTLDSIGLNANFIIGTGDTATGTSRTEIDSGTAAVTATLDMRLIQPVDRPDNAIGVNCLWEVMLINNPYRTLEGE